MTGRIFIKVQLLQWVHAEVTLRDIEGNEVILDGKDVAAPHGECVIELEAHDGVINLPGWLTHYHPSNAHPVSDKNPRVKPPLPHAK